MTNKAYAKGYRFEIETKELFEKRGYSVVRSSGSHTPADLVAMKYKTTILIQCKSTNKKISKSEKEQIKEWADKTGYPFVIMYRKKDMTDELIVPVPKCLRV